MDFHGMMTIVYICLIALVSLFSFIIVYYYYNYYLTYRGKTFEEAAAEKKLLTDRLYGTKSRTKGQVRKAPNKKLKDKKHDKKSKDSSKETDADSPNDESDTQVENLSANSSPTHKRNSHVEFIEPAIVNEPKSDVAQKKNVATKLNKSKPAKSKTGILVNKTEETLIKEDLVAEPLNNFESNPPKDVLETKKIKDTEKAKSSNKGTKKSSKQNKKDEVEVDLPQPQEQRKPKEPKAQNEQNTKKDVKTQQTQESVVQKDIKQVEENAPKKEIKPVVEKQQKVNDTQKSQAPKVQKKKKSEVDIENTDLTNVNSLITVLGRAELTRNEIQILIDFLLNKQQDTLHNHSEWSDDIVQKLRKQLSEKEKALQEEQEASAGIQAKLRELRSEINAERIQSSASVKAHVEELNAKKAELRNLSQELESVNEKLNAERQKYQSKVLEIQNSSKDILTQIHQLTESNEILKSELLEKNELVREFQLIANASRQSEEHAKQKLNDLVQHNNDRVVELEVSLNEATKEIERQCHEIEVLKILEKEKDANMVEIRNLQNALDSTKAELKLAHNEVNTTKNNAESMFSEYCEVVRNLRRFESLYEEKDNESQEHDTTVAKYKANISELQQELSHYKLKLNTSVNNEQELMKQIKEEKEKNNELRVRNWKVMDALKEAEAFNEKRMKHNNLDLQPITSKSNAADEQNRIRDLFQRLFPDAAKAVQSIALTVSFEEWVEKVADNIKAQQHTNNVVSGAVCNVSEAKTQTSVEYSNNHLDKPSNNYHQDNDTTINHRNIEDDAASKELLKQNSLLKAQVAELTSLVTKTENMLTNLEAKARDQEAHWRTVVLSKDEEIKVLRNTTEQAT